MASLRFTWSPQPHNCTTCLAAFASIESLPQDVPLKGRSLYCKIERDHSPLVHLLCHPEQMLCQQSEAYGLLMFSYSEGIPITMKEELVLPVEERRSLQDVQNRERQDKEGT